MNSSFQGKAEGMNRRDFLKLCAVGALPGLLAACQPGPSQPGVTNLPSPTGQPSPTGTDWSELASSLQGTLVRPDSPYYPTARQLFNPRFDSVQPAGIAYCATPADVQTCLASRSGTAYRWTASASSTATPTCPPLLPRLARRAQAW